VFLLCRANLLSQQNTAILVIRGVYLQANLTREVYNLDFYMTPKYCVGFSVMRVYDAELKCKTQGTTFISYYSLELMKEFFFEGLECILDSVHNFQLDSYRNKEVSVCVCSKKLIGMECSFGCVRCCVAVKGKPRLMNFLVMSVL